jgi:uncharacterized protein (TIGR02145 family)
MPQIGLILMYKIKKVPLNCLGALGHNILIYEEFVMRNIVLLFIASIGLYCLPTVFAQSSDEVKIGEQVWMTKNLDISTFRNGEQIFQAKTPEEWDSARKNKLPAWCYYNFDEKNGKKYGKLYNWYAVVDSRQLAPKGFRIPSDEEWTMMIVFLGGEESSGIKLKSQVEWSTSEDIVIGNNSSKFNALPGGYCDFEGSFKLLGTHGYWWNGGAIGSKNAKYIGLSYNRSDVWRGNTQDKYNGYSVRCIKD